MAYAISRENLQLDKKYSIGYGISEQRIDGIFVGMKMKNGDLYPKFIVNNKEILIDDNVPIYDSSKGGRSRRRRKRKQTRKRYKKYTTYK
jgi:hypothetical protein